MPDEELAPEEAPLEPLPKAPLAYENPAFLNSPDGRIIRILAEYSEPLARFRRERIQDTVVFFGSARFRALDVASRRTRTARKHRLRASPRPPKSSPPADEIEQRRHQRAAPQPRRGRRRNGALLRGRAPPRLPAHPVGHGPQVPPPSLRRHLRRRPRHHGSRQPRRLRGRRQNHRPQHQAALRADAQPLHHARRSTSSSTTSSCASTGSPIWPRRWSSFPAASAPWTRCSSCSPSPRPRNSPRRSPCSSTAPATGRGHQPRCARRQRRHRASGPRLFQMADTPEEAFELLKDGLTRNHLIPEAQRQAKAGVEEEEQLLRPEIARTL